MTESKHHVTLLMSGILFTLTYCHVKTLEIRFSALEYAVKSIHSTNDTRQKVVSGLKMKQDYCVCLPYLISQSINSRYPLDTRGFLNRWILVHKKARTFINPLQILCQGHINLLSGILWRLNHPLRQLCYVSTPYSSFVTS